MKLNLHRQFDFYNLPWGKKIYHFFKRQLAKAWARWHHAEDIIMVTGSYGKTSTVYILAQTLRLAGEVLVTDRNLDTIFNLPQTLLRWRKHKYLVLEAGIDHLYEMDFHLGLIKPTVVIFMGVTPVHAQSDLLGSKQRIFEEKSKLVKALRPEGLLIYNSDDRYARRAAKLYRGKKLGFSQRKNGAQYYLKKSKLTLQGTEFYLHSQKSGITLKVKTLLLGKHFSQSFLAAFAFLEARNMPLEFLAEAAKAIRPLPGRLSLEKFVNGSLALNDRLRSNPASAKAGLKTISVLRKKSKRLIVVMGEMGELGRYAPREHRQLGRQLDKLAPDILVAIGPLMRLATAEVKNKTTKIIWAANPVSAAEKFQNFTKPRKGDLFYLKASLLRHLERFDYVLRGWRVNCRRQNCHFYKPCSICNLCCQKKRGF